MLTLAIDFGTSNTLAGVIRDGKIELLPLDPENQDPRIFRTLLYFPDANQAFYGKKAITEFTSNDFEGRLFRSFKAHLPNPQYLGTTVQSRRLPIEEMVGLFLLEVKKRAEKILNQKITKALVGRPALYSLDPVKEGIATFRMEKAIQFAGFEEFQLMPEPIAAAWSLKPTLKKVSKILVGDFGGGTSDFTLIEMGPTQEFEKKHVLGLGGCPKAGDALDGLFMKNRLSRHFGAQSEYRIPMGSNVLKMPPAVTEKLQVPAWISHLREKETFEFIKNVQKCSLTEKDRKFIDQLIVLVEDQQIFSFFEEIEKNKRQLSNTDFSDFQFQVEGIDVMERLSRLEFEKWAAPLTAEIMQPFDEMLATSGVKAGDIDLVCLTGGTAQAPMIRQALVDRLGVEKLVSTDFFGSVISGLTLAGARS